MRLPESALTQLVCPECGQSRAADQAQTFCPACRGPLLPRYDFAAARITLTLETLSARPKGLWRWGELLPVRAPAFRLTLGEGETPLLKAANLGQKLGLPELYIKDESGNPTGASAARGMAVAVSRALELGERKLSSADAGETLAAYAARARSEIGSGFNLSAFQEPYRLEGQKTLGFELAEAFDWRLPEVIIVPTGHGLNLIGLWKAFNELEQLGWIGAQRPRLVCVQSEICAPLVRAWRGESDRVEAWPNLRPAAAGLHVPKPYATRLILKILRESRGTALAVTETEILAAQKEIAVTEGLLSAPEGGAALAALRSLQVSNWLMKTECVVLLNPASGLKTL